MKRLVIYILILIPLAISCQQKYNTPPYDQEEVRLREQNVNDTSLIISQDWEKRDSLSYLRFKDIRHITLYRIDTVPNWIIEFKKTKVLGTFSCGKINMPKNIDQLSELEVLALYDTQIDSIPSLIMNLSKLVHLGIEGNQDKTTFPHVDGLYKLEELKLVDFKEIPYSIFDLKKLKGLYLINCNITELPSSISQLKQLEVLHIHANPIESLPEEIFELPNLRDIHYDKERIKEEQFKERLDEMVRRNDQKYRKQKFEEMKTKN